MWPSLSLVLEAGVRRRRVRSGGGANVPIAVLVVGTVYFVFALLLGLGVIRLTGLEPTFTVNDWIQYGAVLMLVLLLVLLAWSRLRPAEAAPVAEEPPAPAYGEPEPSGSWVPDEILLTADEWHGRRVLEYSRPPKSASPAAVYAKVVVPVDPQYVLRVEDRIAEARE